MKINFDDFLSSVKTKSEQSTVVPKLWIARSAIGISINEKIKPIFGFATKFNQEKAEMNSKYELLEHLVFLPHLYTEHFSKKSVISISNDVMSKRNDAKIQSFLIGAWGPKAIFTGNGCAISTTLKGAMTHSKRELIERHICCEIWYKRSRALWESDFNLEGVISSAKLKFYTTQVIHEGFFAIATLTDEQENFFALGAAIRPNSQEAYEHAAGEVLMLFEDVKKRRSGESFTNETRQKILSLRDKAKTEARKIYFENLIQKKSSETYTTPLCHTIVFEPLPHFYAARTFSAHTLDPREFENHDSIPTLPLF